jgi:uncharacterized protein (DUF2132 family)
MNMKSNDPLHGTTLEYIVRKILDRYGWEELGCMLEMKCFIVDPSISSCLKFLRKTPWARRKVEEVYLTFLDEQKAKLNAKINKITE